MHVTVVVKCEICYLFPFDSCWCIQCYCNPDNEEFGQINPVKSRVPSLSKIFYYKITTNITQNMLGYAVICIPQMAKIDDFTR